MSDSRSIQQYQDKAPVGAIMTPQGPAIIQVIDMPASNGALDYANNNGGFKPRKASGMNIFGAILRRWWLVVLMTAIIGGAGVFAGNNMVKPTYNAVARISFHDPGADAWNRGPIVQLVHTAETLITAKDIPLLAVRDPELQNALPGLLKGRNLDDPFVQAEVLAKMKDVVETVEEAKGGEVVDITTTKDGPQLAEAFANSFARAFVAYCKSVATAQVDQQYASAQQDFEEGQATLKSLNQALIKIKADTNFEAQAQFYTSAIEQMKRTDGELAKSRVELAAAQVNYQVFMNNGTRRPDQELERIKMIQDEKALDSILKAYVDQEMTALNKLAELKSGTMTDDHPLVVASAAAVERAKKNVAARELEISTIIEAKIKRTQELEDHKTLASAQDAMNKAQAMVTFYKEELNRLNEESKKLGVVKLQIDALNDNILQIAGRNKDNWSMLQSLKQVRNNQQGGGNFKVAEPAVAKLMEDKSIKVKAAGMVGGLFLGILLALLVDRFDKRLRNPHDLEPVFSAPLLGTIPRIQELKRIKGEQARNLIAEEFRIIRTQVLFGNPQLSQKIIAITSPVPGDGKTSLAVNLAISIAKAGRRCLLIDGDLRKPDVHRVFNISDTPGFAELIQGSVEPGAAIRKSEIDGLDILPAGMSINRPSELLSRPELGRLLAALGELYDHIIVDTAPLLPVSDTHILAGMVDGVICSFNAEVDRDTVNLAHETLRRCRATVIGTVMNQVKYKQSGSYHRGKSAYDSYYNSPRTGGAKTGAEGGLATMNKA